MLKVRVVRFVRFGHKLPGGYYSRACGQIRIPAEVSTPTTHVTTFKLDYCILYDRLCATVDEQPPMLLLYLLLHRNAGFRNYVLSRVNLENLVCVGM